MITDNISDQIRELTAVLSETFGENFLGCREDRNEMTFWVLPAAWTAAAELLQARSFVELSDLTAVDYLDREPRFDLMAILTSPSQRRYLRLKTVLEEDQPVDTLTFLWSGSNWFEREIFDMFGIEFNNHPDQRRILLPEDYTGHPLRKDFPVTGPASSVFR